MPLLSPPLALSPWRRFWMRPSLPWRTRQRSPLFRHYRGHPILTAPSSSARASERSWPLWLRDDQIKRSRTSFSFLPTPSRRTSLHCCTSCMQTRGYSWRRLRPGRDWSEIRRLAGRLIRMGELRAGRTGRQITRPGEGRAAAIWLTRRIPQRRGTVLKGEHQWPSLHRLFQLVEAIRRRRTVVRTAAIVVMTRRNAGGIADATNSPPGESTHRCSSASPYGEADVF